MQRKHGRNVRQHITKPLRERFFLYLFSFLLSSVNKYDRPNEKAQIKCTNNFIPFLYIYIDFYRTSYFSIRPCSYFFSLIRLIQSTVTWNYSTYVEHKTTECLNNNNRMTEKKERRIEEKKKNKKKKKKEVFIHLFLFLC